jgi:hypothetical protein
MRRFRAGWVRAAALLGCGAAIALGAVAVAGELDSANIRETERSGGTPIMGVRPTGVGLPLLGTEGTVGLGDYAAEVRGYVSAGAYGRDLAAVGARARRYMLIRVRNLRRAARKRCRRATANGVRGAQLQRACRKPKLAIVLDIDETSLSNYGCLENANFSQTTAALAVCIATMGGEAIEPTLAIFNTAKRKGLGTFFITGRPETIPGVRSQTEADLRQEGYDGWTKLTLGPSIDFDTIEYKSGERRAIERGGYRIVLNVGDQESDLEGGHADRAFKYPNPFYFIGP